MRPSLNRAAASSNCDREESWLFLDGSACVAPARNDLRDKLVPSGKILKVVPIIYFAVFCQKKIFIFDISFLILVKYLRDFIFYLFIQFFTRIRFISTFTNLSYAADNVDIGDLVLERLNYRLDGKTPWNNGAIKPVDKIQRHQL